MPGFVGSPSRLACWTPWPPGTSCQCTLAGVIRTKSAVSFATPLAAAMTALSIKQEAKPRIDIVFMHHLDEVYGSCNNMEFYARTVFGRREYWMDATRADRNNPRHAERISHREIER